MTAGFSDRVHESEWFEEFSKFPLGWFPFSPLKDGHFEDVALIDPVGCVQYSLQVSRTTVCKRVMTYSHTIKGPTPVLADTPLVISYKGLILPPPPPANQHGSQTGIPKAS